MSNQSGRGGIGSRKHATGGHAGPSPKAKHNRAREATREAEQRRKAAAKRRAVGLYPSVSEPWPRGRAPEKLAHGLIRSRQESLPYPRVRAEAPGQNVGRTGPSSQRQ
jgi:hypothetical protein